MVYPVAVGVVSAAHAVPLDAGDARVPACRGVELDFRRRAAGPARANRQPAHSRSLEADVAATAKRALDASLDDLGSATFRADLASLRHETQYTRLFRS
jgi:urease accessory protein